MTRREFLANSGGARAVRPQAAVQLLLPHGLLLRDGRVHARRSPYGHSFRLEQNRKPETALFLRDCEDEAIKVSFCAYNNLSEEQDAKTRRSFRYVIDKSTGLRLKHLTLDGPVLNLMDEKTLRANIAGMLGGEHLIFSNHEQYFYKDYLDYQPGYRDKVFALGEMMKENGYEFIFMEDVV